MSEGEAIDVQARQKAGRWGNEKGWHWVSREKFEELCRHKGLRIHRVFYGRRIRGFSCGVCRIRVIVRRSRRRPAPPPVADVNIPREPRDKMPRRKWW